MNRIAAAAAALSLAGCGDYSTEDLRFLAALPTREDLRVEVPADPAPMAQTACRLGSADAWVRARETSDALNASVDWILRIVDLVRREPPTWRDTDARGWGPYDDRQHRGIEVRVIIRRDHPPELGGTPRHEYAFEARVKGTAEWTRIVSGAFAGASASRGTGEILVFFDRIRLLGMRDEGTPRVILNVAYDRAHEPRLIQLDLDPSGGFGLEGFGYTFEGYEDGRGRFAYAFRNAAGDLLVVEAGFDARGGGDAEVTFTGAGGATGGFRQCWDASACLVYVYDPLNLSCDEAPGEVCTAGTESACPPVPAPTI